MQKGKYLFGISKHLDHYFFYSADNKMGYCNRNCNGEFEICLYE